MRAALGAHGLLVVKFILRALAASGSFCRDEAALGRALSADEQEAQGELLVGALARVKLTTRAGDGGGGREVGSPRCAAGSKLTASF